MMLGGFGGGGKKLHEVIGGYFWNLVEVSNFREPISASQKPCCLFHNINSNLM